MPTQVGEMKLYSLLELSEQLSVTPVTLRKYIRTGRLRGQKVGGKWFILEENLRDFFAGQGLPQKVLEKQAELRVSEGA